MEEWRFYCIIWVKDSVAKTNAMQILKQNGIDEVVSV
jgi:hypothetical protein